MDSFLDFLQRLFDWYALLDLGIDATAYFVLAMVGTLLFLLKVVLTVFSGVDADYDLGIGGDGDGSGGFNADAGSFSLFSTLSIVAFLMGAGWMGLIARAGWELGSIPSGLLAIVFGLGLMFLAAGMMWSMQRLNSTPREDLNSAVGATAKVYLSIPARGEGAGEVQVTVSGRQRTIAAVSADQPLEAWDTVKVREIRDDGVLIVEKLV